MLIACCNYLLATFNIKGVISDYANKDITIRKAEGVSYKNMAIVKTNSKGEFSYRVGENFEGVMLVSTEDSQQSILLLTDGNDISFQTTLQQISNPVFSSNSINSIFQQYIKEANRGNLNQILDYILTLYSSEDSYYKATELEKKRLENESFDRSILENYPLLKFYIEGQDDLVQFNEIRDELKSRAERKNIIRKLTNSGEYLETTNLLGDYVSSYFLLGNNIYKTKKNLDDNMKADLDEMLHAVDIETERGQLVLTRVLDLLKGYGFTNLANEYIQDVEGLTCEISSVLESKVKAFGAVRVGAALPDTKLPNGKNLYKIKTKNKIVLFWSPNCPHCLKDLPKIDKLYPILKEKGGELVAFGADTDKLKYDQLTKDKPWINFYDKGSKYLDEYGITAFPTFILVDENNIVKGTYSTIQEVMNNM